MNCQLFSQNHLFTQLFLNPTSREKKRERERERERQRQRQRTDRLGDKQTSQRKQEPIFLSKDLHLSKSTSNGEQANNSPVLMFHND